MNNDILNKAKRWIEIDNTPEHQELIRRSIQSEDYDTLKEWFGTRLQFGTAGLRGQVGPGTNRINRGIVQQTALGIAHYVHQQNLEPSVIIGFDARNTSHSFAKDVADVFHCEGFEVLLFPMDNEHANDFCTTPLLSYGVVWSRSTVGVMITASHNPAPDNGFKVYWRNGAQIIPPQDSGIKDCIDRIQDRVIWKTHQKNIVHNTPPLDLEQEYYKSIQGLHNSNVKGLHFTYTAMHGIGFKSVLKAIKNTPHKCFPVPEQVHPNGDFPTAPFPNPEEDGALDLAIKQANINGTKVIFANDPDADRLAVAIPSRENPNEWKRLTGDQVGLLLAAYLVDHPLCHHNSLLANTIVSSSQLRQIAAKKSLHYAVTLTGFKWLANKGMEHVEQYVAPMLLGYEEALGYSIGGIVQDKDGVSALLVMADLVSHHQNLGNSLWDALDALALEYGLGLSSQQSIRHAGLDGSDKIQKMMSSLRNNPPTQLAGSAVQITEDYWTQVQTKKDGQKQTITLPKSNVLVFWLENQERVIVRPSGTEPKIKFYFEAILPVQHTQQIETTQSILRERLEDLWNSIKELIQ